MKSTSWRGFLTPYLAAATLFAGGTGIANANVIGYTFTLAPAATEVTNYSLNLQKFDGTIGTLTAVTLYFRATETISSFILTNTGPSAETFDATIGSIVNRNATNSANSTDKFSSENVVSFDTQGATCGTVQPFSCNSLVLNAWQSSGDYGPITVHNTDAVYGFTTGTGIHGIFGVAKAGTSISNYVGAGTFSLGGSTLISTNYTGGGGNISFSQATNAGFSAEVDYTYTPNAVPEPATMGLIGSALLGLVALRKRLAR